MRTRTKLFVWLTASFFTGFALCFLLMIGSQKPSGSGPIAQSSAILRNGNLATTAPVAGPNWHVILPARDVSDKIQRISFDSNDPTMMIQRQHNSQHLLDFRDPPPANLSK